MLKAHLAAATTLALLIATPAVAQNNASQGAPQNQNQHAQANQQNQQANNQNQQAQSSQNLSSSEIRQTQQALNQKGFEVGKADGILGPRTERGLKQFQQKQGFNATGQPDQQTVAALGVSSPNGQQQPPTTTGQGGGSQSSAPQHGRNRQAPANSNGSQH